MLRKEGSKGFRILCRGLVPICLLAYMIKQYTENYAKEFIENIAQVHSHLTLMHSCDQIFTDMHRYVQVWPDMSRYAQI